MRCLAGGLVAEVAHTTRVRFHPWVCPYDSIIPGSAPATVSSVFKITRALSDVVLVHFAMTMLSARFRLLSVLLSRLS